MRLPPFISLSRLFVLPGAALRAAAVGVLAFGVLSVGFLTGCATASSPVAVRPAAHPSRASSAFEPLTVIVVRHAEKATEPAGDPPLTEKGEARATALAQLLAKSGVTAIYSTDRRRTRETVLPLSRETGVEVRILPASDVGAMIEALLSHPGELVVSAGHSNTVGAILEGLGAGAIPAIEEKSEYDRLYVVTVYAPGRARAARLSYEP